MTEEYRVSWDIDIWAASPEEAASKALDIMRNPESTATHFVVSSENKEPITIIDASLTFKTKSGKILTEADLQDLADEAEKGYDLSTMKIVRSGRALMNKDSQG